MPFSVANTLEKMQSRDKDYRYMATSDLIAELERDACVLDAAAQASLVKGVLALVDDQSNDVQEIAAKCLGPLVKAVGDAHVLHVAQTLITHLLNGDKKKAELRDISAIALRTVFAELNPSDPATTRVVESLAEKLVQGIIEDEQTPAHEQHLLEVLSVLLERFGSLVREHEALQTALLPLLQSTRSATRKRAIDCLSLLAVHESDALFAALVKHLVKAASKRSSEQRDDETRTVVQLFGAVSRTVGYRLGPFLGDVVPVVAQHCDSDDAGEDEDLREHCLQCFQTLLQRCPADITPHVERIEELALKYLSFDPNYAADSDDDDDAADMDEDDGFDDDGFDDDGYFSDEALSDDDDMSWKVRRACAKCLAALLATRAERIVHAFDAIEPRLAKRFGEREENVKLDVFETYRALLRQARRTASTASGAVGGGGAPAAAAAADGGKSPLQAKIDDAVPGVVAALDKQLQASAAKTRLGALGVLRAVAQSANGATLVPHAKALANGVARSLKPSEKDGSNLRIEALGVLRQLLLSTPADTFGAHAPALVTHVLKAVGDSYYRVASEGLRAANALVRTVAALGDAAQRRELGGAMLDAVAEKLALSDVDQDVKESAIECAASLLAASLGDGASAKRAEVLALLLERLRNEVTRLATVRAFERIALSKSDVALDSVLGDVMRELSALLRQSARQLRQSALQCVCALATHYGSVEACKKEFGGVLVELTPLVADGDLHLAHLALKCAAALVRADGDAAEAAALELTEPLLKLLRSSLLQGVALDSVRSFVATLAAHDEKGASALVERLRALVAKTAPLGATTDAGAMAGAGGGAASSNGGGVALATCAASAQCVAVAAAAQAALVAPLVKDLLKELKSSKTGDARRVADLHVVRELGARRDLASHALHKPLLACFASDVEDVKQAAALALGGVASGALAQQLPVLLDELEQNAEQQYLLLTGVREVIVRVSGAPDGAAQMAPFVARLLPLLVARCESEEEGTRNVVAECMGKLAMLSPADIVPQLATLLGSDKATERATTITALKCAMVERQHAVDAQLAALMPTMLACLADTDLQCRKATLHAMHYAAHSKPSLIASHVGAHIDALYNETRVKPELIREVDLGPFKHKVDDGYELRKAALECCYTLLGAGFARVMKVPDFLAHVAAALSDADDIKMLAHLIIIRLAAIAGSSLLEGSEQLVEPLRATLTKKPKDNAVKQEVERNNELVRSAMRAVRAVASLDGFSSCVAFKAMVQSTLLEGELAAQYQTVLQEDMGTDALGASLSASQRDMMF